MDFGRCSIAGNQVRISSDNIRGENGFSIKIPFNGMSTCTIIRVRASCGETVSLVFYVTTKVLIFTIYIACKRTTARLAKHCKNRQRLISIYFLAARGMRTERVEVLFARSVTIHLGRKRLDPDY
jgi:hypothetical protein